MIFVQAVIIYHDGLLFLTGFFYIVYERVVNKRLTNWAHIEVPYSMVTNGNRIQN